MEIVNRTPFPVAPYPGRMGFPGHSLTLVAKAGMALVHDGAAVVVDDQPYPTGDLFYDDDEDALGGPRYDADFAHFKPAADLLLVGQCHVPGGQPQGRCDVVFQVGAYRARLAVFGRRRWDMGLTGASMTEPEPFSRLALRYENSFGGPEYPRNPVGVGHGAGRLTGPSGERSLLLPRIEHPDRLIASPSDDPGPAGFGPLARGWADRQACLGTYDSAWERHRWPWFPEDFDWRYHSAAPSGLAVQGYLRGDEELRFGNLHPEYTEYVSRLPDLRLRAFVTRAGRGEEASLALEEVTLCLDTLWADLDTERLTLVWRGHCAVADVDATDVAYIYVDSEQASAAPAPLAHYQVRFRERLAEIEEEWRIEEEVPPEDVVPETGAEEREPAEDDPTVAAYAELDEALSKIDGIGPALPETGEVPEVSVEGAEAQLNEALGETGGETGDGQSGDWSREGIVEHIRAGGSLAGADLRGLDLSALDLTGAELGGAILDYAMLSGAVLREADLRGASLSFADAGQCDFSGARLAGAVLSGLRAHAARFAGADLNGADASGGDFSDAAFAEANLADCDLTESNLVGADFTCATLEATQFIDAQLQRVVFDRAKGFDAAFSGAVLSHCTAREAAFPEADFSGATLAGAVFEKANLAGAIMEGVGAPDVDMSGAEMTGFRAAEGSDFRGGRFCSIRGAGSMWEGACLTGADFTGAALQAADFSSADLGGADLSYCDAREARFIAADLSGARLAQMNLFRGSLERARLTNVDITGSNLYGVEFLDAVTEGLHGRDMNLTMTKLAGASLP